MPVRRPLLRCTWSLALALFVACDGDDPEVAVPLPPQVFAPAPPPPPLPVPPLPLALADRTPTGHDPDDPTPPNITWSIPADMACDGAACLIVAGRDPDDLVVSEIDPGRGVARRIYPPPDETATILGAAYSADATLIYIVTDEGDDTPILLTLDRDSGEELAPRVPAPAA